MTPHQKIQKLQEEIEDLENELGLIGDRIDKAFQEHNIIPTENPFWKEMTEKERILQIKKAELKAYQDALNDFLMLIDNCKMKINFGKGEFISIKELKQTLTQNKPEVKK